MKEMENILRELCGLADDRQLEKLLTAMTAICRDRGVKPEEAESGETYCQESGGETYCEKSPENGGGEKSAEKADAEKSAELFPELSRAHAIVDNNNNKRTLYDNKNKKKENGQKKEKESCGAINPDLFFQFFNKTIAEAGSLIPKVTKKTDVRSRTVSARAREFGKDALRTVVEKAAKSDFLNGKNDRSWVATIDWLLRPTVFPKVLDGNYDNRKINNNGNSNRQQDYDRRRGWDAEETNPDDFAKGYRG